MLTDAKIIYDLRYESREITTILNFVCPFLLRCGWRPQLLETNFEPFLGGSASSSIHDREQTIGIAADRSYLEAFFDNLLYGGNNVLSNRSMHDSHPLEKKKPSSIRKQTIVDFVEANPGSSAVIISRELGIPLRTIQRELAGLSDRIEHEGSSKTGGYYLREV